MTRLENWTLMTRKDLYGNTYWRLVGTVCGCNIMTDKLINPDFSNGIAVTRYGTVYKLGTKSDIGKI